MFFPGSRKDSHFPQFRSFDWFDLHSWSRGVIPSADGKDQESTSEELNLLQPGTAQRKSWENWEPNRWRWIWMDFVVDYLVQIVKRLWT